MSVMRNQLTVFLFLITWTFAQGIVLEHEYSAEHSEHTDFHICLSQNSDFDDLIITVPQQLNERHFLKDANQVIFDIYFVNYSVLQKQPRAPPIIS